MGSAFSRQLLKDFLCLPVANDAVEPTNRACFNGKVC